MLLKYYTMCTQYSYDAHPINKYLPTSSAVSALTEKTEAKQAFYDQLPPDFSRETYLSLGAEAQYSTAISGTIHTNLL